MLRRGALAAAVAALAFPAALPAASFPPQRQGSGKEATAGGGVFAGKPYRARSALVKWDGFALNLYLLAGAETCATLFDASGKGDVVQVILTQDAKKLPVGAPLPNPTVEFVSHGTGGSNSIGLVQRGVKLVLSRVDTSKAGVWHGSLSVAKTALNGKPFSYAGTFAARGCGSN